MENNILELKGICKTFGVTKVLNDVDLSFRKGELHAFLGENGAGKSTLIKIISGVYRMDKGEILYKGEKVNFHSPDQAQSAGIATLFQELQEFPELKVAENVFSGIEPKKYGVFVDWSKLYKEAQRLFDESKLKISAYQNMNSLTVSSRKMVEIIRALHRNASVVIMDEPTANLNQDELDALFAMIEELKRKQVTIIYISHRLREIFQLADRVSVLRDGCLVKTLDIGDCTEKSLINLMIGREISDLYPKKRNVKNEIMMSVKDLSVEGELHNVSFDLRKNEILGIAGLDGSGATSLSKAIFGLRKLCSGSVECNGKVLEIKNPQKSIAQGIAYLPVDRKTEGLFLNQNLKVNITVSAMRKKFSYYKFLIKGKAENESAQHVIKTLGVKSRTILTKVGYLSGGNQQKVLLGRWLVDTYDVLLLEDPTRGVDIGAKIEIYQQINELVNSGMSVIMYSSELPELLGMCDRVLVFRGGKISASISQEEMTEEKIIEHAILK